MSDGSVGITTGPILEDQATRAAGIDAVPSTAWQGQDWAGLTKQISRALDYQFARTGVDPVSGVQAIQPETPISADEANQRYGIDGALHFTDPVPDSVAASMSEAKRDELAREDTARRAPADFWSQAGRVGAGFVAGALDPTNVAATFVPVVGEARYATWLADAGSFLGRSAIRFGVGAAQGAAGQALLAPLRLGLAQQEQSDYHASDALLDVLYGGLLGGGMQAVGGGVGDVLFRHFRDTPQAALADGDLATREAAARTSIAQIADGRPVEVAPVFDAAARAGEAAPPSAGAADPRYASALRDVSRGKMSEDSAGMSQLGAGQEGGDVIRAASTEAPNVSPALADLKAANATIAQQLERQGATEMPAELTAANDGVNRAEGLARAYAQAATCLGMR